MCFGSRPRTLTSRSSTTTQARTAAEDAGAASADAVTISAGVEWTRLRRLHMVQEHVEDVRVHVPGAKFLGFCKLAAGKRLDRDKRHCESRHGEGNSGTEPLGALGPRAIRVNQSAASIALLWFAALTRAGSQLIFSHPTNQEELMSAKAEGKGWVAHSSAAMEFYTTHGGENMSPEDRATFNALVEGAQEAARRHDEARGDTAP